MATTINKAEFDALPQSLKSKFKNDSADSYSLIEEDVEGLKKSKADILTEKKSLQERLEAYEAKEREREAQKALEDEEAQKKAGKFEEIEKKLRDEITRLKTDRETERNSDYELFKRERLANELIKNGVLPDRAKYALGELADQIELEKADGQFSLKVKNGIGDAAELTNLISGLKERTPFFFASNNASGSGASGSQGTGGNAKIMSESQFDALSPKDQAAFVRGGGVVE